MKAIRVGRLGIAGAALLAIIALVAPARAAPYFVSTNGNDSSNGLTWASAWATLGKAGITATTSGDSVTVSNGTYAVSSEVKVTNGVTFKSANGYAVTTVTSPVTSRMFRVYTGGILDGFTLTGGNGGNAGGVVGLNGGATLQNCHLYENYAIHGAVYMMGAAAGVRNCLINNNSGSMAGGIYLQGATGAVENCTIYGNVATNTASALYAGGISVAYKATVLNCIVYDNTGVLSQNYGTPGTFEYSCTTPDPGGVGIVTNDPQLNKSGNFHLWSNSLCIDAGTNLAWNLAPGAPDLGGRQRIFNGTVDMGAFEFGGPLECDFTMDDSVGFAPHDVVFSAHVAGSNLNGLVYQWAFTNSGVIDTQGADKQVVTNRYAAGVYIATLTATNHTREIASFSNTDYIQVGPATTYVAQVGSSVFPYDSWATAATNFQPAIDAGVTGTVVLVSNGTYTVSTTTVVHAGVTLRSANGYSLTTIQGSGAAFMTFDIRDNGVLDGFTITKGKSLTGLARVMSLGNNATLQNCHVHHNTNLYGILMNVALVRNCLINNNSGTYAGGIYIQNTGAIENCTLHGNVANFSNALYSGGISFRLNKGTAHNCIVYGNTNGAAGATTHNYGGSATLFDFSCTTPDPGGGGIVTNDPLFVNAAGTNFHLQDRSPAVSAGTNLPWILDANARDLDGNRRRRGAVVNMGAFELIPRGGLVFGIH